MNFFFLLLRDKLNAQNVLRKQIFPMHQQELALLLLFALEAIIIIGILVTV
jgi:hypothetical protein